jgi:hypothetical protein
MPRPRSWPAGVGERQRRRRDEAPSELWTVPWQRLVATGDLRFLAVLRPFLLALDRVGVAPEAVSDEHLEGYREALAQSRLSRAPGGHHPPSGGGLEQGRGHA